MEALLDVDRVTKAFGHLIAVDDVSLSVRSGEIYGIAGPNGAGKTTLFNALTGVPFRADSGRIMLDGRRIDHLSAHQRCRLGVVRTFQTEASFDSLSVSDNVRLGAVFGSRRSARAQARAAVVEALELVGIAQLADHPAATLSLFGKKKAMLASALACRPRLLLMDEPGAGLNQPELAEMERLIKAINRRGVTLIIIEHVLPLLLGVADRVMVLHHGARLFEGTPAEFVRDRTVIDAYLGERADVLGAA